jgi:ribosome biogenesis GTPase
MLKGKVYKSTGSWYNVKAEDGKFYDCRIKGKFRIQGIKTTNPVSVGDEVMIKIEASGTAVIQEILPRKNYIIRKSVNLSKQTHIIASNIDVAFLLVTYNNPPTLTPFIDRFLVTAEAYQIPAVLLFNKIDTYSEEELDEVRFLYGMYESIGYKGIGISAKTGKNLDKVKAEMSGKTCLFSGHSGTGKSTLMNQVAPGLNIKTAELSETHTQGQHTTTFAQMYDVDEETRLIDTPGIKGFGVVDMDPQEIDNYFPEFFALKQDCKFNDCLHVNEPKCAVKKAVEKVEIPSSRYESYLQMITPNKENYRIDKHHQE